MRRARWCAAALLLLACDARQTADPSQWPIKKSELATKPEPGAGEKIYARTCVACHGIDGSGGSGGSGNGAKTGASFIAADGPLGQSDDVLVRSILDGKTGPIGVMPAHRPLLSEGEARSVLAYVRERFGKR